MTLWVIAYLVQIGFGIWVAVTTEKKMAAPARVQAARGYAIWAGLVPFVGLMLVVQLVAYAYMRSHLSRSASASARLQSQLPTSFGAPATRAPASTVESSSAPVSRAPGSNPFL